MPLNITESAMVVYAEFQKGSCVMMLFLSLCLSPLRKWKSIGPQCRAARRKTRAVRDPSVTLLFFSSVQVHLKWAERGCTCSNKLVLLCIAVEILHLRSQIISMSLSVTWALKLPQMTSELPSHHLEKYRKFLKRCTVRWICYHLHFYRNNFASCPCSDARVVKDLATGKSKGYGFVSFFNKWVSWSYKFGLMGVRVCFDHLFFCNLRQSCSPTFWEFACWTFPFVYTVLVYVVEKSE